MLLQFAIKDFLEDREFQNLSPKTISTYRNTLTQFHQFCVEKLEIVDTKDITHSTIKSFLMYCQRERKNNPTSINHKLRNIRSLCNYLQNELEVYNDKTNPCKKIKFLKEEIKIEVYTNEQIKQMLNYYRRIKYRDKSFFSYRDTAIIITLLGTGIRLGELCNLRWQDVSFKNNAISIFGKKRQTSSIPMAKKLEKELYEYKIFCEKCFENLPEYVFTTKNGKQLSTNAIKCIFKHLKLIMGFQVNAHRFRHSFAHNCLLNGMDIFTLQKMLRHNKLAMTEKYLSLWGVALKSQNEKFNPLNGIDL